MANTVKHTKLDSPTSRAKLKRGRAPHMQALVWKLAALGYQRSEDALQGRWFLRRNLGGKRVSITPLGLADDLGGIEADGVQILTHRQAEDKARKLLNRTDKTLAQGGITVEGAFEKYITRLKHRGKRTLETERRAKAFILPKLGKLKVSELTTEMLQKWLAELAASPALLRSAKDSKKRNTKPVALDEESIRKRQATANRILTMLKAGLNFAAKDKTNGIPSRDAWGVDLERFESTDVGRPDYLKLAEAKRLINACDPDFRLLVVAALQTGCRYGELCRLVVKDFNADHENVEIRKSKSGRGRSVSLTPEGVAFFREITVGRTGSEIMLKNNGRVARALEAERAALKKDGKDPAKARVTDKGEWRPAEQARRMRDACEIAKIDPPVPFHTLRHTWASLAIMGGMAMAYVAENLGHASTVMTEKHYKHIADSAIKAAVRKSAPRFGFTQSKKVVALSPK